MNIAVTASGGGVGQSIIKSLRGSGYNIIALDSDILAAGLYMVNDYSLIPKAGDDDYIVKLLDICKSKNINLLFPGMDCELKKLSENRDSFAQAGTKIVISSPDVVKIADDKYLTNRFIYKLGLPTIKTIRLGAIVKIWNLDYPVIMKPKVGGARSRDVYKLNSQDDIPDNIDLRDYVLQEYIEGDEYTCGTVTLDGKYKGCIILRRILRDGDTYKAFVEHNTAIENLCEKVCTELKPFGAFNIQLRLKDGIPYVFEFNARCSGTTASRTLAGFNEPKMIADYLLKVEEPSYKIKDITILRYWNEIVKW
jgi:carbamoyl-phosphate synthase large subunit